MNKIALLLSMLFLLLGCGKEDNFENNDNTDDPVEMPNDTMDISEPTDTMDISDPTDTMDMNMVTDTKMFSLADPHREFLHDSINNLLIVMDRIEGEIISYSYERNEVLARISKNFWVRNYALDLYSSSEGSKLYLGYDKDIFVYDAISLQILDTLRILEQSDIRYVSSIEARFKDLLFLGVCNSSFFDDHQNDGTISYNIATKTIIDQSRFGANCLRVRGYLKNQDEIGVLGIGHGGDTRLILDSYTIEGKLVDNKIDFNPRGLSFHLVKTTDKAGYFVTKDSGTIIRKSDLMFEKEIDGFFKDFLLNPSGSIIYGLSFDKAVDMIDYESLNVVNSIPLNNLPLRGFFVGGQMLIVSLRLERETDTYGVYLTKVDI